MFRTKNNGFYYDDYDDDYEYYNDFYDYYDDLIKYLHHQNFLFFLCVCIKC